MHVPGRMYIVLCILFPGLSTGVRPRLRMACFLSGAVSCCIERTKRTIQPPLFSDDALSKNDNSRSLVRDFFFFFSVVVS